MAGTYAYTLDMITRNAPPASGVYVCFAQGTCVYVGESDDVCTGLLEVYYEDNPCLNDMEITHFSFDIISPESRVARQIDRIRELRSDCNLRTGAHSAASAVWVKGPTRNNCWGSRDPPPTDHPR